MVYISYSSAGGGNGVYHYTPWCYIIILRFRQKLNAHYRQYVYINNMCSRRVSRGTVRDFDDAQYYYIVVAHSHVHEDIVEITHTHR